MKPLALKSLFPHVQTCHFWIPSQNFFQYLVVVDSENSFSLDIWYGKININQPTQPLKNVKLRRIWHQLCIILWIDSQRLGVWDRFIFFWGGGAHAFLARFARIIERIAESPPAHTRAHIFFLCQVHIFICLRAFQNLGRDRGELNGVNKDIHF